MADGNRTVVLPLNTAPLAAPQLIGTLLNWGLFGALSIQVYIYHLAFPNDRRGIQTLVYVVYMLDLVQTILVTQDAYTYFAVGFGDMVSLGKPHLEWFAVPTMTGIVSCTVQMYYAYRVLLLSGNKWMPLFISVLALMQGSAGIAEGVKFLIIGEFAALTEKTFVSCSIWHAGSAACDISIAASMTFLLLRRDTRVPATRTLISKIVRLVVETGILTSITTTVDLIVFMVLPGTSYHAAIALILAKLYSNSMLVILNSRLEIVGGRDNGTAHISIDVHSRGAPKFAPRRPARPEDTFGLTSLGAGVHVQKETWAMTDTMSIPLEQRVTQEDQDNASDTGKPRELMADV